MTLRILNKDFQHPADGWYQIEATGNHPNRAAGVVQVIDTDATLAIVNRFNAEAAAGKLRHGNEMLIDHEHFSDQPDQETRAYGWLQELQNREDGIYGRVHWTTTGKAAVDGGDYRFFSTEYDPADCKVLNDGKPKRVRPTRLAGLTLTNMNNNRGQKPITNRKQKNTNMNIAEKIGLPPEADEAAITNRIDKILNGDYVGHEFHGNQYGGAEAHGKENEASRKAHVATGEATDKASHQAAAKAHLAAAKAQRAAGNEETAAVHEAAAKYHTGKAAKLKNRDLAGSDDPAADNNEQNENMTNIATKLGLAAEASESDILTGIGKITNRLRELEADQVDGLLAERKITDEKTIGRLKPILIGISNREERRAFLDDCKLNIAAKAAGTKVLNRGAGTLPETETADSTDEKSIAQKITNRATELRSKGITWDSAWRQAQREVAAK